MKTSGKRVKAWDWFNITGRGIVVSVDVSETNGMGRGDEVQFDMVPNDRAQQGLINETATYRVLGVEESRCLVAHGPGSHQCTMARGLAVVPVREMEQQR